MKYLPHLFQNICIFSAIIMLSKASGCKMYHFQSSARIQVSRAKHFRTAVCFELRVWLFIFKRIKWKAGNLLFCRLLRQKKKLFWFTGAYFYIFKNLVMFSFQSCASTPFVRWEYRSFAIHGQSCSLLQHRSCSKIREPLQQPSCCALMWENFSDLKADLHTPSKPNEHIPAPNTFSCILCQSL